MAPHPVPPEREARRSPELRRNPRRAPETAPAKAAGPTCLARHAWPASAASVVATNHGHHPERRGPRSARRQRDRARRPQASAAGSEIRSSIRSRKTRIPRRRKPPVPAPFLKSARHEPQPQPQPPTTSNSNSNSIIRENRCESRPPRGPLWPKDDARRTAGTFRRIGGDGMVSPPPQPAVQKKRRPQAPFRHPKTSLRRPATAGPGRDATGKRQESAGAR